MISTREIILETLMEILEKGKYSHLMMKGVLDKYAYLERSERAFMKRVCEGCVERKIQLDYVINLYSNTKVNKMKPVVRNILRMGVYQILFMDKVPDSAACNEAVKLMNKKSFSQLKGFVNAVLRTVARQKEKIEYPLPEKDFAKYLEIMYSMPAWIVSMWLENYGKETTEKILKGLLEERPLTLRLDENLSEAEKEKLLLEVKKAGIKAKQSEELAYAYFMSDYENLEMIPGFLEGKWMVQDLGSMLITQFADIKKGDFVMDVCGAPGGKALHAAAKVGKDGSVVVRDLTEYKVSLIEENIERSGYETIRAEVFDATIPDKDSEQKADVVIADLPCSGLGVIGRKADIKYRITKEDLNEIAVLQRKILKTVGAYVKSGGTLLYSTCTLNRMENEENVAFIERELPFVLEEKRELLPGIHGTDGFFMARFKRK